MAENSTEKSGLEHLAEKLKVPVSQIVKNNPLATWDEALDLPYQKDVFKYASGNQVTERVVTYYIKSTNYELTLNEKSHVLHGWCLLAQEIEKYLSNLEDEKSKNELGDVIEGCVFNVFYLFLQRLKIDKQVLLLLLQYHASKYDISKNNTIFLCVESFFLPYITFRTEFFSKLQGVNFKILI